MAKNILDAVYGCLIGGAVGDALGAPVEGWDYEKIRQIYGRLTEIIPSTRGNTGSEYGGSTGENRDEAYDHKPPVKGQFSDDTTMRHLLCLAIVRKNGRVTPDEYAEIIRERLNPNRVWTQDKLMLWKLKAGMNPWECGMGLIPCGCATMGIAPMGIINAGNPRQAYQDAFNIASINQIGHNRDGAATFAAGVAAAFVPGATLESVLEVMRSYSSALMQRAIYRTMKLARACKTVDEFAEKYYATMLDYTWVSNPGESNERDRFFSGNTIELVPITMAILHLTAGDTNQAMIEAASFGRDCDTTAGMAGSITGALHGATSIRQDWIATVENANEDFYMEVEDDLKANFHSMAQRMVEALHNEQQAASTRADFLKSIL